MTNNAVNILPILAAEPVALGLFDIEFFTSYEYIRDLSTVLLIDVDVQKAIKVAAEARLPFCPLLSFSSS